LLGTKIAKTNSKAIKLEAVNSALLEVHSTLTLKVPRAPLFL